VLSTFAYPHGLAAKAIAEQLGVPYVVKARGSDLHALFESRAVRQQLSEALCNAAAVVPVSSSLARIAGELGVTADRLHVLANGVDADRFDVMPRLEARQRLKLDVDGRIVLFLGSLLPVKGIDVLIEAIRVWQAAAGSRESVTFFIGGDGPLRRRIGRTVRRHGLSGMVKLVGHVQRDQVGLWMNAADALILPSRNEGCPNVVLESLACGTPVVASGVGAVPDIVGADCGFVIEPGDPQALMASIRTVLSRQWDRQAIRAHVDAMTWQDNAARLLGVLNGCLAAAQGRTAGANVVE